MTHAQRGASTALILLLVVIVLAGIGFVVLQNTPDRNGSAGSESGAPPSHGFQPVQPSSHAEIPPASAPVAPAAPAAPVTPSVDWNEPIGKQIKTGRLSFISPQTFKDTYYEVYYTEPYSPPRYTPMGEKVREGMKDMPAATVMELWKQQKEIEATKP
jgi:hypothetical protein